MTMPETRFSFAVKNILDSARFISFQLGNGHCVGSDKSLWQYDTMSFVKRLWAKKEDDKEPDDHYDPDDELKRKMEDKMPKGYIMVSYLELPTDENLATTLQKLWKLWEMLGANL